MRNRPQQLAEDFCGVRTELSKLGRSQATGPTTVEDCNRTPCPRTHNTLVLHLLWQTAQGSGGLPLLCAGRTPLCTSHQFLMRPGLFTAASHTSTDPVKREGGCSCTLSICSHSPALGLRLSGHTPRTPPLPDTPLQLLWHEVQLHCVPHPPPMLDHGRGMAPSS